MSNRMTYILENKSIDTSSEGWVLNTKLEMCKNYKGFWGRQDFMLTKTIECNSKEDADEVEEKFERLKLDNFGKVLIPEFKWTREYGCKIILQQEFINKL